jgi:abequosyltransferase
MLSFVIPTYNFGKFIGETVKSITEGVASIGPKDYEIIILDGGSSDETNDVVANLASKYKNIIYKKNSTRGGIDRDLNEVAGMASGNYIWFFSADDILVPGWDLVIAPLLVKKNDIYLVPAELCDLQMKALRKNPIFSIGADNKFLSFSFDFDKAAIRSYLEKANTLEALFSFMSSIIIKKAIWDGLKDRPDYYGSCWAHCAKIIPTLFGGVTIGYVNQYLIKKRGGNDSFMENGFVSRIGIAVDGWGRITHNFFNDSEHQSLIFRLLRKDMPILLFMYAKITAKSGEEIKKLNKMARSLYCKWGATRRSKVEYYLYRAFPASKLFNKAIKNHLPLLISLRHKIKNILEKYKI